VPSELRGEVQAQLMGQMVKSAREEGATQLLGLCPRVWMRWMRRLGYQTEAAGPVLDIGGAANRVVLMNLRSNLH
jgi:N-acyl-L-homoserine lactone synthetase